ncbi:MAG: hypothetical protein QOJ64_1258 [Acidobacteriota bacterium]|jgi:hypothetical protein|nr:hypothetical protein [Acidobacteriota bacterium]
MKRLLLITVISLLLVSGWSHVLAAALCPQMQVKASCPMQLMHHSSSSHETMAMGAMGDMPMTETGVSTAEVYSVDPPMGSCPHCFSKSEYPTSSIVAVKGVDQGRRNLRVILQQALAPIAFQTRSFAAPILTRQHAPPQAPTARHVLISVFLI